MEKIKKVKILAAGDIHGDTSLTKRLAEKADKENVDLVILTGDFTFLEQSTKDIIGPFEKVGKKVLIIPGNHETVATTNFLAEIYSNAQSLHGYYFKIGDVGIFGAGGTSQVGPFSRFSESELYNLLKKGFEKVKDSKIKIMATHSHPSKSLMERFTPFFKGSSGIEQAIKSFKPDLALCSHVHEAWGIEEKMGKTKLINVGREGKIFEV
jgi:uncharacterized protein